MNKTLLLIGVLGLPGVVLAQTSPAQDPTGFTSLIIQKVKDTQSGGSLRLSDGKIGALVFLPIKTFHTEDKKLNWLMLNAGMESLKDERPNGILFCSTDIVGLTNKLLFNNSWTDKHVTGSGLPPVQVGVGPAIPLNYNTLQHWTFTDFGRSLRLTASVRFGDVLK